MERLIIAALVILGVWEATAPDMILGKPAAWLQRKIGATACKPLFLCPVCCASVWGCLYFFFSEVWFLKPVWFVLALAGLLKLVMLAIKR